MNLFFPRQFTHRRCILPALLAAVTAAAAGWGSAVAQAGGDHSNRRHGVKIGVLANRGSSQCLQMWGATADYLTARIPGQSFEIVPLGYADVEPAIVQRRVDFILVNSSQYVTLEQQYQISRIATLKNKVGDQLVTRYGSVIICRGDRQDMRVLGDLRDKSFMAPEEDSFGGWVMTLRELRRKGIDPAHDFASVHFGGTQDAVVRAVLAGDVDAGTIRTNVLEPMLAEGKIRREDFRVLSAYDGKRDPEAPRLISTRSYPEWPMARPQYTPLALAEQVAETLRIMPADAAAAQKADIAGWSYPADYRDVRECLKELQIGPYRPSAAVTLAATLRVYWPWLLVALLAAAGMAATTVIFARMNGRLALARKAACDELAERRAAEERLAAVAEALHDRNQWLGTVVSASADAIIAIDERGAIMLFNPAAGRIFGWRAEEMIGQPVERLMAEELRETHRQSISGYFKTGKPDAALGRPVELIGVRSNGDQFPLELSIAVGRPSSKQFAVAVLRDITQRKQHEEELCRAVASAEEATSRLRKLTSAVEQSPASVVITNLQGVIEYVNPGFVHTTGYAREEVLGNSTRTLKSGVHPPEFYQQMWTMLARGEVWRGELCNRKKNGELFWEDATIAPVADAQGAVNGFVAVKVDITSRKQAEEALRAAKEQAEEASRAKSQFLAAMSHELRTPLNGVIGMTELLQRTELDDRQRRFVEACQSSGKSLLAVINDILDFSKIEAGKLELDQHEFDLDRAVEETVETMAFTARQKGIELLAHVAAEARCRVVGDSGRLRQLLVNLIGNAVKFTEAGQVTVRVAPAGNEGRPDTLRFEVSDTGIGIPPDRLDRLFQSFSQADSSTTRKYGGTGLGLAISKKLVTLMGGQIGVASTVGSGSTFWFTLPWKAVARRNDSLAARKTAAAGTEAPLAASLAGTRVLLAEDNRVNRMFAGELLRQAGVEFLAVENGRQVLETVRNERFDLILMDCQMPEMDGFDSTRRIREMERGGLLSGHLPVIALTANAIKGDRERCVEAGMDDYLSKPFEPRALFNILAHFLGPKKEMPADAPVAAPPDVAPQPDRTPPIDRDALAARCMGNLQFAASLLADFAGDLPDRVEQILRSVRERDAAAAGEAAHALKGAAGILAAEPLRAVAARIEATGKAGNLDEIALLVDELRSEAQRCLQFIPELRNSGFAS